MLQFLLRPAIACLIGMTLVLDVAAREHVWVALAEEAGPYAEAAAVLQAELADTATLTVDDWPSLLNDKGEPPDLIVTVGAAAFEGALKWLAGRNGAWSRVPVLATLLPQGVYTATLARMPAGSRSVSAAVLDQPFSRQLALLKRALPERRRVGVLSGPQTRLVLPALQKAADARGLTLVVEPVGSVPEGLYSALKSVLDDSDVLLALPEPTVYNGANLQNILLTTYRARDPLFAFSAAYVKSGAVLAVYSTPAQVARRAAEMLHTWLAGRGLPAPQTPREFDVAVNNKVASSLDLPPIDAAGLAEELRRQEAEL